MVRINLLPVRVSKKRELGKQHLAIFALVLVLGLGANYFWAASRAGELKSRQQKLQRTREDIAQLERIIGEVRNIKEQQQALQQKLDILERLKSGRSGPVRMLDELATLVPRNLSISKLDEKNGTVIFVGSALTIDDVSTFMAALKTSRYFAGVELKKTASAARPAGGLAGDRMVNFEITAQAKYAATADGKDAKAAAPAPAGKG
jgi:type IV pilus assembly protein PilN